ncbi:Amino acid transporter AVT1J [Vitis vinifera]|uniref:Amino acid transporter AVT1J n=1 Tax=Vitis vinifera TaxID=29760 RepID=A0A438DN85_VITVI|nr:Amino acid transporter AVT1J [Vitis vinifera]
MVQSCFPSQLKTDVESRLQCTDTTGTGFIRSCYIAISAFLVLSVLGYFRNWILTLPYAVARSGWGHSCISCFPFCHNLGGLRLGGELFSVVVTALVILPSALLTDLGVLSYVFAMGAAAIIIIVVSILFTACFGGHPVVPTVYISMKNKHQFTMVMLISFFSTMSYTYPLLLLGISCMLGNDSSGKQHRNRADDKNGDKRSIRLLTRIALLISTAITACIFPYFESLMAVVGSICVVLASFLLPCCCYLKISGTYRKWSYELVGIIWDHNIWDGGWSCRDLCIY